MTNDRVTPFLYEGETVRVIDKDGAPWFVAADVCRSLGLSNPSENVSGLDDDEKGISTTDTLGGNQGLFIISESGMFSLIFKSRKAEAARFRRWVTGEVLPSIRRTGAYVLPSVIVPWHPKPFEEWSLEEWRLNLSTVNAARMTLHSASGAWMWEYLGFPLPPRHLLPSWWQGELLHGHVTRHAA